MIKPQKVIAKLAGCSKIVGSIYIDGNLRVEIVW